MDRIYIQTLGGFCIRSEDHMVQELSKRAPKFWKVLQYLIVFRNKIISQDELINAMWPEGQAGDPKNAMRNMVFRIRSELVASGIPQAKEMILFSGESYNWNNTLDCEVDCEEFERIYLLVGDPALSEKERLELLLKAVDIYKGDFLPNAGYEMWAIPLISYYKGIFLQCAHMAMERLTEEKRYSDVEKICKKVLSLDRFDEKTLEYHLKALIGLAKQADALSEYQKITTLLYEELGVSPSESLRNIYLEILNIENKPAPGLDTLIEDWTQKADFPGAFYCDYGVFRIIYQVEARSLARTGQSACLFSMDIDNEDAANQKRNAQAMEVLYNVIQESLRKGDLFTRTGPSQYLLLLQNLTYEDCKTVIKRIAVRYRKAYRAIGLKTKITPMIPLK